MSSLLSSLSCCWFWLLLGGLIGWLLNRFMCKCCCQPSANQMIASTPVATDTKVNKTETAAVLTSTTPSAAAASTAPVANTNASSSATPKPAEKASASKEAPKEIAAKAAPQVAAIIDLAAAKKAGFALKNANDLTVVEGIGPKINDLFNNAGVKTFSQLSKQSIAQMRKVLDDGGSRFRIANPSTWAQQAALAAENKWDELKKLQNNLSGGVKK